MKEQFVNYEIALGLKKLGFDGKCFGYFKPMKNWMMEGTKFNPERHFHGCNWANPSNSMYFMYVQNSFGDRDKTFKNIFDKNKGGFKNVATPLYQQAQQWLREVYNLHIECNYFPTQKKWGIIIMNLEDCKFIFESDPLYETYEQALEQSILKAIELCKKNL